MESDGYDLKWKDHVKEVFGEVQKLRTKDYFSDVIVHCGGRNFRAHKVILAASSTFFEKVLTGIPRERSHVLVMVETSPELLERVLDFIYDGEAFVSAESLETFMKTAEKLGIRGLQKGGGGDSSSDTKESRKRPAASVTRPPALKLESEALGSVRRDPDEDTGDPLSASAKRPKTAERVQRLPTNVVIDPASDEAGPSGSSSRASSVGFPKVSKKEDGAGPSQAGPSRTPSSAAHPVTSNDEDDIVELDEEGGGAVKTEGDESNLDYSNDGTEQWGEGAYGDEEYYEEGGEGQFEEGGEGFPEGDGDEQPQNIPPEIAPDTVEKWKPHIFRGVRDGRKTFFCNFCCYMSPRADTVKRHLRIHTNEKPYACPICSFCSARNDKLKTHMAVAHGETLIRKLP